MIDSKIKAIELRKTGLSYRAISKEIGVPLSTLSHWFSGEKWSLEIAQKLTADAAKAGALKLAQFKKARGFALQFSYARAKEEAAKEFKKYKKSPLFFAGLGLYWASGDYASTYYLKLTSADPNKIYAFSNFVTEYLQVPQEKISYSVLSSFGQNVAEIAHFWQQNAKIPLICNVKVHFKRKPRGKSPTPSSVCSATYSSRYHKEKMLVWLRLLSEEFSKE